MKTLLRLYSLWWTGTARIKEIFRGAITRTHTGCGYRRLCCADNGWKAVKGYYDRFLKALPTVKDLAEAEEDKLLKLWEGLGYYNRVRNMQKAAQQIMVDHEGIFPNTYEEILQLKGIGNYTAGAISAFAYGIPKPAVDGNVLRDDFPGSLEVMKIS